MAFHYLVSDHPLATFLMRDLVSYEALVVIWLDCPIAESAEDTAGSFGTVFDVVQCPIKSAPQSVFVCSHRTPPTLQNAHKMKPQKKQVAKPNSMIRTSRLFSAASLSFIPINAFRSDSQCGGVKWSIDSSGIGGVLERWVLGGRAVIMPTP